MLGKVWKKVLLVVLIVACLFDVVTKLVRKNSLNNELTAAAQYLYEVKNDAANAIEDKTNQVNR
jgi:hypothetical protein